MHNYQHCCRLAKIGLFENTTTHSHNIDLYIYVCFCFHNKRFNIWSSNMLQYQAPPPGVTVILPCSPRTSVQQRDICRSKLIHFLSFQVLLLLMDTVGPYLMHFFEFFEDWNNLLLSSCHPQRGGRLRTPTTPPAPPSFQPAEKAQEEKALVNKSKEGTVSEWLPSAPLLRTYEWGISQDRGTHRTHL